MSKLVIVESPAKARTIEKYLGKDFKVAASVGHIIDLPKKELGVDVEHDFKPSYEVMPEKKKTVTALKNAAKNAEEIYLAPDPDREGEAIAWHIANLLKKKDRPMHRVLINEITKQAVIKAIEEATELDEDRFEAQQARRILDRLVGYKISPLLSKKFKTGLSAGRVQSVALRLVVERERDIRAFKPDEYWSIDAMLQADAPPDIKAKLAAIKGKSIETPGEKFDPKKKTYIPGEDAAKEIVEAVKNEKFVVSRVVRQERKRNPLPPFITSTIQQEAARKLGFTAKKTMTLAQRLYEGQDVGQGAVGLITYMRTDAPRLSNQALDMARGHISATYGKQYLPSSPNLYRSKKGAQEAHEAIRPTSAERTPEQVSKHLDRDMARLYELIFNRFIASQMKPAVYDQTTAEMEVRDYLFRATGRILKFKGFLAVYEEAADDDAEKQEDGNLPELKEGQELKLLELLPEQHFTKPPPRFTEASLVKELEEKGIGRPSTYAQILSTIMDREYVKKESNRFQPTPLGERINDVLVEAFPDIIDVGFTAQMEGELDKVEEGKADWVELLKQFYGPFSERLEVAAKIMDEVRQEEPTDIPCPVCGKEMIIKWSRQGEFMGCSAYPDCKFTCDFERKEDGTLVPKCGEILETPCPECGKPLQIRESSQGEFVGCTDYPTCKFTSDFQRTEDGKIKLVKREEEDTGITCEQCGRPMIIKKTRKGGKEFIACSGYPDCKNAMDFVREEDGKIKVIPPEKPEETGIKCEKCGKPMVIKTARKSGKQFLACTGYPKCKNAKDFIKDEQGNIKIVEPGDEGPDCPECGKPMILKRSRFGTFWACTGYPDCKNTTPSGGAKKEPKDSVDKKGAKSAAKSGAKKSGGAKKSDAEPLPDEPPCEKCGAPMVRRQGRYGPFIACSGYPQCKNIRKKKKSEE